jgi:hypothetical protein
MVPTSNPPRKPTDVVSPNSRVAYVGMNSTTVYIDTVESATRPREIRSRFLPSENASLSGEALTCIVLNSIVSSTWRRIYQATGPISRPKINGIRQPQLSIWAVVRVKVRVTPIEVARTVVSPWLANCQLAKKPRLSGSCSARKAVALPNSPPAEKPWINRATTMSSGANNPAVAYVGAVAIIAVPTIISRIVSVNAALRP